MKKIPSFLIACLLLYQTGQAQHKHSPVPKVNPADTVKNARKEMQMMEKMQLPEMHSLTSSFLPMNFDGGGTAWQPEETPMSMWMKQSGRSEWSLHSNVYLRYTNQDISNKGSRGDAAFNSANYFMGMWRGMLNSNNTLAATAMLSLEPFTVGAEGSPLLFQTGETNNNQPLVDHQHPHDLFMGLALHYTHSFSRNIELSATAGYPYEPALGPPTAMHRLSALMLPDMSLGHHWQDATHISYGVATIGLRANRVKLEGSLFNGREPDEDRYDFDPLRMDSHSFRFTWNPVHTLSFQVSSGWIVSPEVETPKQNIRRNTFSVLHTRKLAAETFIASALVVGVNDYTESARTRSFLVESLLNLQSIMFTGRYEFVQKSAEELVLRSNIESRSIYDIHVLTLGIGKQLNRMGPLCFRTGINGSFNLTDNRLESTYGKNPWSLTAFLLISPPFMHRMTAENQ